MISQNVKALLSDVKEAQILDAIQASIVRALEKSSSWVDMYECTGELYVPNVEFDGTYPKHEDRVKEVRKQHFDIGFQLILNQLLAQRLSGPPNDDWRQFTIPVDLPCVDVGFYSVASSLATDFPQDFGHYMYTPIGKSIR